MLVKWGKNRFVLVFPAAGVALKFPIVHLLRAARQFFSYGFQDPYPGEVTKSLTEHLVKGIGDNWREFRFYLQTRHPFCQPTYFSFFGLLNLQQAAHPCRLSAQDLWSEIHAVTAGEAFKDAHHFSNPQNFCHDRSQRLKIIDYGHPTTAEIVQQYGTQLHACHHRSCLTPDTN